MLFLKGLVCYSFLLQLNYRLCCLMHRGKILEKRINVRVEHVKHSRCRQDFLDRVKANEVKKRDAKEHGTIVHCKRQVIVVYIKLVVYVQH